MPRKVRILLVKSHAARNRAFSKFYGRILGGNAVEGNLDWA